MHRLTKLWDNIDRLKDLYSGEELQVIGSGPSLAQLSSGGIGPGPVVAINFAILSVDKLTLPNPVYSMQKDKVFVPDCNALILAHSWESAKDNDFGDYVFDCEVDFGIPWQIPSVVVCLYLARFMGCKSVRYLCCDSFHGDLASYDGKTIVKDHRMGQYAMHPTLIRTTAEKIGLPWSYV